MDLTCNLLAIDPTARSRYDTLRTQICAAVISYDDLTDGYVLQLDEKLIGNGDLAERIGMEQICCPFLSLELAPAQPGVLELKLRGPSGSRAVLLAEFVNYWHQKRNEEATMQRVGFGDLPWIVRIVIGFATFNLWWSFEEFVIDRFGIWRYLPDYKFGRLCVWDLTVATGIAAMVWWLSARKRQ